VDGSAGAMYWSSTIYPHDPEHAQLIVFGADGSEGLGKFRHHFVRAVRGPSPFRFVDNGDGTISDTATGLVWEKKSNDGGIHDSSKTFAWSTGASGSPDGTVFTQFLAALNKQPFAGHSDWRLPTAEEFRSLNGGIGDGPCGSIDLAFSNQCPCDLVGCTTCLVTDTGCSCLSTHAEWSSTNVDGDATRAVTAGVGGSPGTAAKTALEAVRAVRQGP
jgi:hypothetical protein